MDEILKFVASTLPTLDQNVVADVVRKLASEGLESMADGLYLEEKYLDGILKPIQNRKLLISWKIGNLLYNLTSLYPHPVQCMNFLVFF